MHPIRVLVVDDDPLFADSLALTLAIDGRIAVAGIAHDGLEALQLCRRSRPDVVLMDLHMPGMDGIETTRRIRETHPRVNVVMLTGDDTPTVAEDAVDAGVVRFLLKRESLEDVRDTVVSVPLQRTGMPMRAA